MYNPKITSFKVPRSWQTNVPRFTTDDPEDLLDFVEQVEEIFELADIKDDAEKKRLMTSYMPFKKRTIWRSADNYANLSYDDFHKTVYNTYPEIMWKKDGTIEALEKLCNKHQGIRLQDEGKLKRFGIEFSLLFKKLSKPPAIILNKEACLKYLETLDLSFANILHGSISMRNLFKADINRAAGVQPPVVSANGVDFRKEDPILLKDLMEMAEQLATMDVTGTIWERYDVPEKKPSSMFSVAEIDHHDERLEELSKEIADIKDSLMTIQREAKASHAELIRAFREHLRAPPPHMDVFANEETTTSSDMPNHNGQDQFYEIGNISSGASICFYCRGHDHFARKCPVKIEHINNGWLITKNGIRTLGDGEAEPRGPGPTSVQVEEYYAQKATKQNLYSTAEVFYANNAPNGREMDALQNELKTLRVRLNQIEAGQGEPANMASIPVQQNYVASPRLIQ